MGRGLKLLNERVKLHHSQKLHLGELEGMAKWKDKSAIQLISVMSNSEVKKRFSRLIGMDSPVVDKGPCHLQHFAHLTFVPFNDKKKSI